MRIVQCKNGHFYDADKYASCPHCEGNGGLKPRTAGTPPQPAAGPWGALAPQSAPVQQRRHDFGSRADKKTVSIFNTGRDRRKPETEPAAAPSVHPEPSAQPTPPAQPAPVTGPAKDGHTVGSLLFSRQADETPEEKEIRTAEDAGPAAGKTETGTAKSGSAGETETASSLQEAIRNASANEEGRTMSYFESRASSSGEDEKEEARPSADPVVGWLVCVKGLHFGESFPIASGKNSIGRNSTNRIAVPADRSISKEKHAFVIYDPVSGQFYLQPGDSSGLTYLNGECMLQTGGLKARDRIGLGTSEFLFVPLCGDNFSWEKYI